MERFEYEVVYEEVKDAFPEWVREYVEHHYPDLDPDDVVKYVLKEVQEYGVE